LQQAAGFNFLLHDLHQVRPPPCLVLTDLREVDHIPMVGVGERVVDLLAPDAREDPLRVAWLLRDQAVHLVYRRGDALGVGVIEDEALAVHLRA